MQVKGRGAFASPIAQFTPPGKAVREKKMPPRDGALPKIGWLDRENGRKTGKFRGGFQETGRKRRNAMGANEDKAKFSIRVDTQLLELADSCIGDGAARSRTELIGDALRFYLGYLMAEKAKDYLLQSLSSAVAGTVQDSENRLARMDFKIAVELLKLSQVIAYTHDVDEESLNLLHAKCVEEVKRINGAISFEDASRYQRRET